VGLLLFVMGFNKKGLVVVVLVVVGLLSVFDGDITGEVIEDLVDVDNCSDYNIGVLWDNVFDVDDSNLIIIKENVVGGDMCEKYVAYKNDSEGQVWVLYESFYDNSWTGVALRYNDGKKILNEINLLAFYIDVEESFLDSYIFATDVDGILSIIDDVGEDDSINWSILDESSARVKVDSILDVDVGGLTVVETGNSFKFSEDVQEVWLDFSYDVGVSKNKSLVFMEDYVITNYDPSFVVGFTGDIPDYEFDMNSSWNSAFNVSDYFNVSEDVDVSFSSVGADNTNGVWINSSIDGGIVKFKPAVNFAGSREFILMANNPAGADVFSNAFNVTIVDPNVAPTLLKDFGAFYVPRYGGLNVFLSVYFEDPNGDNMTFRVTGDDDDLNISIRDDFMVIKLEDGFNESATIQIRASDGTNERSSGDILVFEYNAVDGELLTVNLSENSSGGLETVLDDEDVVVDSGNESGASAGSEDDGGGFNWVLLISVIVGLLLVLAVIWFFVLRKGDVPASNGVVPSSPLPPSGPGAPVAPINAIPQNPVNNYLSNLNLVKR